MTNWQDKRIYAMNRIIQRKGRHLYERYIDEDWRVKNSKAKNKKEYKELYMKEQIERLQVEYGEGKLTTKEFTKSLYKLGIKTVEDINRYYDTAAELRLEDKLNTMKRKERQ